MTTEDAGQRGLPDDVTHALEQGPFHAALRLAIAARGLPLDRLRYRLHRGGLDISLTTLSSWQHGRTQPERPSSLAAVGLLETELDLPPGALLALLGPRRPRGPHSATLRVPRQPEQMFSLGEPMSRLLDRFPEARAYDFDVVNRDDTLVLDDRGDLVSLSVRMTISARRDGLDSYYSTFAGDPGADVSGITIEGLTGVTVEQSWAVDGAPGMLTRLRFDDVLREGDDFLLEYRYAGTGGVPLHYQVYAAWRPTEQYLLHVRFHPDAVPQRVFRYDAKQVEDTPIPGGPVPVSSSSTVHMHERDVLGRVVGLCWVWETAADQG